MSSTCTACLAGTFASLQGTSVCSQCAAGTFRATTGGTAASDCASCPDGLYATGLGMTNTATCFQCGNGKYWPTQRITSSETQCLTCPDGTTSSSSLASPAMSCTFLGGYFLNTSAGTRSPPSGMTRFAESIGNTGYVTYDPTTTFTGWKAFDFDIGTTWRSASDGGNKYSDFDTDGYGYYAGSVSTSKRVGFPVTGEWLEIRVEPPIVLGRYNIIPVSGGTARAPLEWRLLASNDGQAWDEVDYVNGAVGDPDLNVGVNPINYTLDTASVLKAYSNFRLITESISEIASGTREVEIAEWPIFGGLVQQCQPGGYAVGTDGLCVACPAGKYSSTTGASIVSACTSCGDGLKPAPNPETPWLGSSSCTQCSAGTAGTGGSCSSCSAGKYTDTAGLTACTPCGAGTFSGATAANSAGTCILCVAGTYSPTSGAISSATCTGCAAGYFATGLGEISSTVCGQCVAGKFAGSVGSSTCTSCPDNSKSQAGVSVCQANAGFYFISVSPVGSPYTATGSISTMNAGDSLVFNGDTSRAVSGWNTNSVSLTFSKGTITATQTGSITRVDKSYPILYSGGVELRPLRWYKFDTDSCLTDSGSSPSNLNVVSGKATPTCYTTSVSANDNISPGKGSASVYFDENIFPVYSAGLDLRTVQANTGFTMSFWVYPINVAGTLSFWGFFNYGQGTCTHPLSGNTQLFFRLMDASNPTAVVYLQSEGNFVINSVTLQGVTDRGNGWTHVVAGTSTTNDWYFWVNGVKRLCPTCANNRIYQFDALSNVNNDKYLTVGGRGGGLSSCTANVLNSRGSLDDLRFYTGLLSDEQVSQLYTGNVQVYSNTPSFTSCGTCASGYVHCTPTGTPVCCGAGEYFVEGVHTECKNCANDFGAAFNGNGESSTCTSCPTGQYVSGTTCGTCTAGTYTSLAGQSTCTLCSAGSYFTGSAAPTSTLCTGCAAGKFSTASGAIADTTCQSTVAGTYCTGVGIPASAQCLSCNAGTYQTGTGMTQSADCAKCGSGTYSITPGATISTTCTQSSPGTYCTGVGIPASSGCTLCGAGTYLTGSGMTQSADCAKCGTGTYSVTSGATVSTTCTQSSPGTYCTGLGIPASSGCTLCGAGTYSTASGVPASSGCTLCNAGTYSTGSGVPASLQCTLCGSGTYSTASGASASVTCTQSAAGTYCTGSGIPTSAQCTLCAAGTYSVTSGATVVSLCTLCGTGTYSTASGASASATCTKSAPGTYCTGAGIPDSVQCPWCGAGTYSTASGAVAANTCVLGPAGTYSTGSGIPASSQFSLCGTGTYSTASGAVSGGTCLLGPAGTYSTGLGIPASSQCTLCGAGTYSETLGALAATTCVLGPAGTYSTGSGIPANTQLSLCGKGLYSTVSGAVASATCVKCVPGTYSTASGLPRSAQCTLCNAGAYSTGSGLIDSSTCLLCDKGKYSTSSGIPASSGCVDCSAGTYSSASGKSLASDCTTCTAGSYSALSATVCTSCPPQSSTPSAGATQQDDCKCNAGFSGDPKTGCDGCPANSYCSAGTTIDCPEGYFSLAGSTLASHCQCQTDATYVDSRKMCTCRDGFSMINNVADVLGNRRCITCPANFYCSMDATTACPDNSQSPVSSVIIDSCNCNDGYYRDSGTCPICPPGFYCKDNNKYSCPDNTNSLQGSSLQADCKCNAGFRCTLKRDVSVVIKFSLSRFDFENRLPTYVGKLADLAGVSSNSVVLTTSSTVAGRRLLQLDSSPDLSEDSDHNMIEISAHILLHPGADLAGLKNF